MRIINGEISADKIYEDDRVIAMLDIHPVREGHTLVILKKQIDHIWDLDDDDYAYLWRVSNKIGKHIRAVLKSPRVGVVVEGFGVPHVHIHLIPIYKQYDLSMTDKDKNNPTPEQFAAMAERLRM